MAPLILMFTMQGNIKLEDLSKLDISKPLASLVSEIIVKFKAWIFEHLSDFSSRRKIEI